ncbi:MAG: hypothetical protein ACLQVF_28260 [Isosphaeraceae bacterium]
MTHTSIQLNQDTFAALFPLIPNHLNADAGWAQGNGRGCLFETYGDDLAFVRRQNPRTVWTLVDGGDEDYLLSGYHHVNRVGYLVSAVPVPRGVAIRVRVPA